MKIVTMMFLLLVGLSPLLADAGIFYSSSTSTNGFTPNTSHDVLLGLTPTFGGNATATGYQGQCDPNSVAQLTDGLNVINPLTHTNSAGKLLDYYVSNGYTLTYDLGSPHNIAAIQTLSCWQDNGRVQQDYSVDVSADGVNWTNNIAVVSGFWTHLPGAVQISVVTTMSDGLPIVTGVRYIRFNFNNVENSGVAYDELSVYDVPPVGYSSLPVISRFSYTVGFDTISTTGFRLDTENDVLLEKMATVGGTATATCVNSYGPQPNGSAQSDASSLTQLTDGLNAVNPLAYTNSLGQLMDFDAGNGNVLTYDLGSLQNITGVQTLCGYGDNSRASEDYNVEFSADNINWTTNYVEMTTGWFQDPPATNPCDVKRWIAKSDGSYLATGVRYVRFNFPYTRNNGIPYTELAVYNGAFFALQPIATATNYSGNAGTSFSVHALGDTNLSYQWQACASGANAFTNLVDDGNVAGSSTTNLTLTHPPAQISDYRCVVTYSSGTITSAVATATILDQMPIINVPQTSQVAYAGSPFVFGSDFTITGSLPLTGYQWLYNGSPLSDSTDGRIIGSHSSILTLTNVLAGDAGTYQLIVSNGVGATYSATINLTETNQIGIYYGGSYSNAQAWTLNGVAKMLPGNVLKMTDKVTGGTGSAFFNQFKVNANNFQVSFVYSNITHSGGADGFSFILQNAPAGLNAMGGGASGDGYVTIPDSVALCVEAYNHQGWALGVNGSLVQRFEDWGNSGNNPAFHSRYLLDNTYFNLSSDPLQFTITYSHGIMKVWVSSLNPAHNDVSYTWFSEYQVDIPTAIGGSTAYLGFGAGTGGLTETYEISQLTYSTISVGGPLIVTNYNDPNFDTAGNANGNFALAEYYGVGDRGTLTIGNANFIYNGGRIAHPYNDHQVVNFGSSPQQVALSNLVSSVAGGPTLDYTLPTIPGHNYKMQMLFHENYWTPYWTQGGAQSAGNYGHGDFTVLVNGAYVESNIVLSDLPCYGTNSDVLIVTNYFTASSSATPIHMNAIGQGANADAARITAITLEDFNPSGPYIFAQPSSLSVTSSYPAQFSVVAGDEALAYQWQARADGTGNPFTNVLNGANVTGVTTANLTISNTPFANMDYQVVITNSYGAVTSSVAVLTVIAGAPVATTDLPSTMTVPLGSTMVAYTAWAGSVPMTFQWTSNGVPMLDGGRISGSHSNVLVITGWQAGDSATYQVTAHNSFGSTPSTAVTVGSGPVGIYVMGPDMDPGDWVLNGNIVQNTDVGVPDFLMTDGGHNEAGSAFYRFPMNINDFTASFTYEYYGGPAQGDDGLALVFQNDARGPHALGGTGSALGYGGIISNSVALELEIFSGSGMAINTNGQTGSYISTLPVGLTNNSDPINVTLMYQHESKTLVVLLTDTITAQSYTNAYTVDIPAVVGGSTAYFGFTAGSASLGAIQYAYNIGASNLPVMTAPVLYKDVPATLTALVSQGLSIPVGIIGPQPMTNQWLHNGINLVDNGRINGSTSGTLTISSTVTNDAGQYQLIVGSAGGSLSSGVATVTVLNQIAIGDGSGWMLNNGANILSPDLLQLTDRTVLGESRTAFLDSPLDISDPFVATFTYQDYGNTGSSSGSADGASFVLQNSSAGASAVGNGASGCGYGGLSPSAAILFNIYQNNTIPDVPGMCLNVNGKTFTDFGANPAVPTTPVSLVSGDPIGVTIYYNSGVMFVTLTDAVTQVSYRTNYMVNLPAILGGTTAYAGFGGGSGGVKSDQRIRDFSFITVPIVAVQKTGASITLSWPVNAGQSLVLQQSSILSGPNWTNVPDYTLNVVGENYHVTLIGGQAQSMFYRLGPASP